MMGMPMNEEIEQRWQEALRSSDYDQGIGHLRINDEYCRLGVLCDLYDSDEWISGMYFESAAVLPVEVMSWAGLNQPNPSVRRFNGELVTLGMANDVGKTFPEIADLIEQL